MLLQYNELSNVRGGAYSASMLNYFTRSLVAIFEFGKSLGSSIRRLITKDYCNCQ